MVDHDITLGVAATDEFGENLKCCEEEHAPHPSCMPIKVPKDDPFYKFFKRECMNFVKTLTGLKPGCPLGARSLISGISAYIDASYIYGSTQELAQKLREKQGGRLRSTPIHHARGMKDLLPMKTDDPDKGCERGGRPNLFCFEAGDARVNVQITLTALQTIWMREHNRIADYLAHANPKWDDEKVYQETRRIVIASFQHITFNEFLPVLLGRDKMHKYGLDLVAKGYYEGYDPKINAAIRLGFQAGAYRLHSLVPDVFERYNKYHEKLGKYFYYRSFQLAFN